MSGTGDIAPGDERPIAAALRREGAHLLAGAATPCLEDLKSAVAHLPRDEAGIRLHGVEPLRPMLAPGGCIGALAADVLGPGTRAVRAVLFDKTEKTNWSLAWHQDRTICVRERRDVPGFGPWTVKRGLHHVAPPAELLGRMITLRVHLDDVAQSNAPLMIAPGSHAQGMVPEARIAEVVRDCGTRTCLAVAGDVWLYATLVLHASDAATQPGQRRVLQVDYAAFDLPADLEWLGV